MRAVRLLICGTRGSTPSPGPAFIRYGGQTSCIAVARGDDDPHLVLDGGTGLRRLTKFLDGRTFNGTILIGHLHWDHTHGLPFFRAGDKPDARVKVMIPSQGDAAEVMARAVSPPHFPVRLEELQGAWSVENLEPGTLDVEGFQVTALDIPHKLSRTYGFRISDGSSSIAYMSDHWPTSIGPGTDGFGDYHENALALANGVDVLIHDAQYDDSEYGEHVGWGHSAIGDTFRFAALAGVGHLVPFHHDPSHDDRTLDAIYARDEVAEQPFGVTPAREGAMLEVARATRRHRARAATG
jgi:phosphoribosyl 1,2-cyclic phosphodiesterase